MQTYIFAHNTLPLAFVKNISKYEGSDAELLAAFKATGDKKILAALYQPYMELLYGVCLKYLRNEDDAKDAVINIFEELLVKIPKHDISYFKGWIYQLCRNHCLMKLRKDKTGLQFTDTEFVHFEQKDHLDDAWEKEESLTSMHKCLQELAGQQKKCVEAFYLGGSSYKQIAESTGLEVDKVRSYIQNGRRNLKICMEKNIA